MNLLNSLSAVDQNPVAVRSLRIESKKSLDASMDFLEDDKYNQTT